MPRIPKYDNFQLMPSANTGGRFPLVPTPPDAGALAKQTGHSLNEAGRLFAYAQGEQNQTMVDDLTNQMVKEANRLQFDPEIGALSLQGKNALERPNGQSLNAEYGEKFKMFANKLIGEDTDTLRRQALQRRAIQISSQLDTKLTQHVLHQNNLYKDETYKSQIAVASESAALNWGDDAAIGQALIQAEEGIGRLAEIHGWSEDTHKANARALLTPFHTAVIAARIDAGQSASAQKYFNIVQGDLTPEGQNKLRDAIRRGGITTDSMRLFDSLKGGGIGAAKSQLQKMFQAGEITAEVRDATDQRLQANWQFQKAQQAEGDKALFGKAYDFIRNNPGKTYADLPVSMQQALSSRGMNHTVDGWFKTGGNAKTDSALWASIMSDPSQLSGMSPIDIQKKWGAQVSETDLRTLYAYTEEGRKEKGSAEVLTTSEVINASAMRMGYLDPKKTNNSKEMAENFYKFQLEVQRHIDDYKTTNKKSPSLQDIRKMVSDIETNAVRNGIYFQTETPVFALTDAQRRSGYVSVYGQSVDVAAIPADVRAGLMSSLRRMNIFPSEKEIAQLWVDSGRSREVKKRP